MIPGLVVLVPGSPSWWVVYATLSGYAEDARTHLGADLADDDPENDLTPQERERYRAACALVDAFDSTLASLAESHR